MAEQGQRQIFLLSLPLNRATYRCSEPRAFRTKTMGVLVSNFCCRVMLPKYPLQLQLLDFLHYIVTHLELV